MEGSVVNHQRNWSLWFPCYQLPFQIHVVVKEKNILCIVFHKGFHLHYVHVLLERHQFSFTCNISSCFENIWWSYFSSLWNTDYICHWSRGKKIFIDVEVVDAPLENDLIHENNRCYAMKEIISSIYRIICFPHHRNVITIN